MPVSKAAVTLLFWLVQSCYGQFCPELDQVTFNRVGVSCQLPDCDASCMSGYLYSQSFDGTTCNVQIDPVTSDVGSCQCLSASGTTQEVSFDGGDTVVLLSWNGVPGESELIMITPSCQLVYDPESQPATQLLQLWAIILIAFVGLFCIGFFASVAYRVTKSRPRDEMNVAINKPMIEE